MCGMEDLVSILPLIVYANSMARDQDESVLPEEVSVCGDERYIFGRITLLKFHVLFTDFPVRYR